MVERHISIDKEREAEYNYLLNSLQSIEGITYAEMTTSTRYNIYVAAENNTIIAGIEPYCEEILLTAMKWKLYIDDISARFDTLMDKALLFALMDFDTVAERRVIRDLLKYKEVLSIDAIFNFNMQEIKESWAGFTRLARDFYHSLPDEEDSAELITFMMSVNNKRPVRKRAKYFIYKDKNSELIQDIFYYNKYKKVFLKSEEKVKNVVEKVKIP